MTDDPNRLHGKIERRTLDLHALGLSREQVKRISDTGDSLSDTVNRLEAAKLLASLDIPPSEIEAIVGAFSGHQPFHWRDYIIDFVLPVAPDIIDDQRRLRRRRTYAWIVCAVTFVATLVLAHRYGGQVLAAVAIAYLAMTASSYIWVTK